jgi:hypothetical protein
MRASASTSSTPPPRRAQMMKDEGPGILRQYDPSNRRPRPPLSGNNERGGEGGVGVSSIPRQNNLRSHNNVHINIVSSSSSNISFYSSYQYTADSLQRSMGQSSSPSSSSSLIHPHLVLFDLLRLLRYMERHNRKEDEREGRRSEAAPDDDYDNNSSKVHGERVDHLENLWRQLGEADKTPQLRSRIDTVNINLNTRRRTSHTQQQPPHDSDLVQRIFFSNKRANTDDAAAATTVSNLSETGTATPAGRRRRMLGQKMTKDPWSDTNYDEDGTAAVATDGAAAVADGPEGGGEDDKLAPPSPPSSSSTPTANVASMSVQQLQEDQRQQMEAAIAMMASQLKRQTEAIHHTLQTQNAHLGDMEGIVETNVDQVDRLAKDVTQHVRKGWTRTLATWMVIMVVAIAFVLCCLVILMIPKRPGACLLFCPKPQRAATTAESAQSVICHDNADGTQECVSIQEALTRLYSQQQDKPPQQSEPIRDVEHEVYVHTTDQDELGAPHRPADIGDEAIDHGNDFHECQWDGTDRASSGDGQGCATEATMTAGAAPDAPEASTDHANRLKAVEAVTGILGPQTLRTDPALSTSRMARRFITRQPAQPIRATRIRQSLTPPPKKSQCRGMGRSKGPTIP